jgi:16S rRNA processing protein RimM
VRPPVPPATKRESLLGSSSSTEPERHVIGRLGRPHGLDGFLGVYVDEDDLVSLEPGSVVYVSDEPQTVRQVRRTDRGFQIAFRGVTNREGAEEIRGSIVAVAERRPLLEGEFWPEQLIGLVVLDDSGAEVGKVERVLTGPGQDRLLVRGAAGVFEVPFVDPLVPVVDLEKGRIEIIAIPGLVDGAG